MAGKQQRQHRVARLLEEHRVTNQSQLVDLLATEGVTVNQATVSRDLEELGAIKVRVPGGDPVYAIPELPRDQVAPEDHLRRVLRIRSSRSSFALRRCSGPVASVTRSRTSSWKAKRVPSALTCTSVSR